MNLQSSAPEQTSTTRTYSEEEQRLRWALIIETILRDPSPSTTQQQQVTSHTPATQPQR